tara:strand:+ start:963 stop:1973 length:1011 start_codon:yes stop_codon:yes gene_type:complete
MIKINKFAYMKFHYLFFLFIILFSSCETDFDVNAQWEDVTIVYGLIDPNIEDQLIKINKAFLGQGDALQMASIADSSNYNPSDLHVKIHRIRQQAFNQYDTLSSVTLNDTILDKDDGLFSTDNNIIYTFKKPSSFYNTNSLYALEIINLISGHKVTSQTEIINTFSFESLNPSFEWGLYNGDLPDSLKFRTKNIEWQPSTNGVIYQLDIVINYIENNDTINLPWSQPLVEYTSGNMSLKIKGDQFFQFLTTNLTNNTPKQFLNLDLVMTVGSDDLKTYINVNKPFSGIVQERPVFSNINNGVGLFSSRFTYDDIKGIELTNGTINYMINDLDLGFE